jgi:hypothetical protein
MYNGREGIIYVRLCTLVCPTQYHMLTRKHSGPFLAEAYHWTQLWGPPRAHRRGPLLHPGPPLADPALTQPTDPRPTPRERATRQAQPSGLASAMPPPLWGIHRGAPGRWGPSQQGRALLLQHGLQDAPSLVAHEEFQALPDRACRGGLPCGRLRSGGVAVLSRGRGPSGFRHPRGYTAGRRCPHFLHIPREISLPRILGFATYEESDSSLVWTT